MELMNLANELNNEEQRYVREGFSNDEELSMYDLLFKDDLTQNDIKKIKEVAVDLLQKIKPKSPNSTIGQINRKQKQPSITLSAIPSGQNSPKPMTR